MKKTFESVEIGDELYYYPKDTKAKVTMTNGVVITCELKTEDDRKEILKFNYEGILLGQKKPTLFWCEPRIEIPKSNEEIIEEALNRLKVISLSTHHSQRGYVICHNGENYHTVMHRYPSFGTIQFHDYKDVRTFVEFLNNIKYDTMKFEKVYKKIFMGGNL